MKLKTITTFLIILVTIGMFLGFTVLVDKDPNATRSSEDVQLTTITPLQTDISTAFPESFEGTTFPPAGWIKFNVGGGTGWNRQTVGTTPIPGWTGGIISAPPGGGNAVAFCTWSTGGPISNDQWLVTPQINGITASDSLIYWIRSYFNYNDTLEVRVSTTTPTVGGFTNLLATHAFTGVASDTVWTRYAASMGSFAGQNIYIAFREKAMDNLTNGDAITLDLVDFTGAVVGVTNNQTPVAYDLAQNHPNPFNPTTTIDFKIPIKGFVTLKVYDATGKEVTTLMNGVKNAGTHSVEFNASGFASGVYFYRIEAGDFVNVKKMILMK